ncbi:MAG: cation transport ATPase [Pedosphaera sp.]|nr:cation transport ATPase [Pedosphaera sp.]
MAVFADQFSFEQGLDGVLDIFIQIRRVKLHDEGNDAPVQGEFFRNILILAEGVDGGEFRSQPGDVAGHAAAADQGDDGWRPEFIGHDDSALGDLFARVGQFGMFPVVSTTAMFCAVSNAIHGLNAFQGIFANGGFAAEHDGVGLFEDGIGDIGHFRAGGHGRINHAFEHVGGDNDGTANVQAGLYDATLDDGKFFVGDFDAEVATGNHNAVGSADDGFEIFDGFLVFNLGDDHGVVELRFAHELFEFAHILGATDEREGDVIDSEFKAELDVGDVFFRESGKADFDAGEVDMATAAELAIGKDFAFNLVAVFGEDFHLNGTIVHEHNVAYVDVVDEPGVIDVDGVDFLALGTTDSESEAFAGMEIERGGEFAGADGGALGIHEDADANIAGGGGCPDVLDHAAGPIMGAVGHVETEDVQADVNEAADHFR